MLSIVNLVEFESECGAYRWYGVEPKVMFETTLSFLFQKGLITQAAFVTAHISRDNVSDLDILAQRNEALEFARKFFWQELVRQLGNGACLHIKNDPSWRL